MHSAALIPIANFCICNCHYISGPVLLHSSAISSRLPFTLLELTTIIQILLIFVVEKDGIDEVSLAECAWDPFLLVVLDWWLLMGLPLWFSRYAPRFCPPFSASGRSFFPPKIWPCLLFYSDLVGSHFEAPHFQHVDALFAPQIDQIYHFIKILLGPILNFQRRTPTDFDPECIGMVEGYDSSHNNAHP